jgi:hypothetical protein
MLEVPTPARLKLLHAVIPLGCLVGTVNWRLTVHYPMQQC